MDIHFVMTTKFIVNCSRFCTTIENDAIRLLIWPEIIYVPLHLAQCSCWVLSGILEMPWEHNDKLSGVFFDVQI